MKHETHRSSQRNSRPPRAACLASCLLALWLLAACVPPPLTPVAPAATVASPASAVPVAPAASEVPAASVVPAATVAPAASAAPAATGATIANPASQNCVEQGGKVSIETRPDGGQYGVCLFADNRQCEEWALLRGDCPVGGVKVTGYVTQAARYCAISGGTYAVTGNSGSENEQGTCTFKAGGTCDAWAYYNGQCTEATSRVATPPPAPAATQSAVGAIAPIVAGAMGLAFSSDRGGSYSDVYSMNTDGSNVVRLTQSDANNFAGPWSPDAARLAYTSFGLTNSDVSIMSADGSGKTNLTHEGSSSAAGFPAWSPDGRLIAFTTRRDGNNEIYVMAPDGSGPKRLTNNPTDDFAPTWSPDGSQLAFASDRDRQAGYYSIYLMQADGSGVRRLTTADSNDYGPAWSPDGTRIAFYAYAGGSANIQVVNVDGSGLHNLTDSAAEDQAPAWSPDGTRIAFQTNRDGNWEIYLMTVPAAGSQGAGTNLINLTNNPANDQTPFWRPAQRG